VGIAVADQYRSKQDIVFQTLKDEILSGRLRPGDELNTLDLSKRLGVSRTPIREALNRLTSIGLAESEPHRGAFVKELSLKEVVEMYWIRGALGGIAARLATRNLNDSDRRRLLELCDSMDSNASSGDSKLFLKNNSEFHTIIYHAAQSPMLETLLVQYDRQSEQYRALGFELPGRASEISDEHRQIADALLAGKKMLAEKLVRVHLFNTASRIAKSFGIDVEM